MGTGVCTWWRRMSTFIDHAAKRSEDVQASYFRWKLLNRVLFRFLLLRTELMIQNWHARSGMHGLYGKVFLSVG